jgi:hypothetical protein
MGQGNPLPVFIRCLIPNGNGRPYKYSHKEVIDNIAFSDQERFSSESRSWLLGVVFSKRDRLAFALRKSSPVGITGIPGQFDSFCEIHADVVGGVGI